MRELERLWQSQPVEVVPFDPGRKAPPGDWGGPTQASRSLRPMIACGVSLAVAVMVWVVWSRDGHRDAAQPEGTPVLTDTQTSVRDAGAVVRAVDASNEAYLLGKSYADRRDFRRACLEWKRGQQLWRGNIDLLRALTNVCTRRAQAVVTRRDASCAELKAAFDFAVDGDGLATVLEARRRELSCAEGE